MSENRRGIFLTHTVHKKQLLTLATKFVTCLKVSILQIKQLHKNIQVRRNGDFLARDSILYVLYAIARPSVTRVDRSKTVEDTMYVITLKY